MKSFFVLLLALTLSACSTLSPVDKPTDGLNQAQRRAQLQALAAWQLRGRIAIRTETDGITANLDWRQDGNRSDIRLAGAFGAGATRVVRSAQGAEIYLDGDKPLYGDDAESLLYWETGLRIPLQALSSWLIGLAGPFDDAVYDDFGRLETLSYTDPEGIVWRAGFEEYTLVEDLQLPLRIQVRGAGFTLRLSADEWLPGERRVSTPAAPPRLMIPGRN
ncbi:lipoprotein insertase outer membrane protein LolB [Granulosicoccaceae sp. 1_MG-2023]|nr:lipoprotein insertase outer membrane protein LolB [Granulosicoccaceae sp. 1_MG-2023]